MALRKMTVKVPAEIAAQQLIRACEVANQDPEVSVIEGEMDALIEEITEPSIWVLHEP